MHMTVTQMIKAAPVMITITTSAETVTTKIVLNSMLYDLTVELIKMFKSKLYSCHHSRPIHLFIIYSVVFLIFNGSVIKRN